MKEIDVLMPKRLSSIGQNSKHIYNGKEKN